MKSSDLGEDMPSKEGSIFLAGCELVPGHIFCFAEFRYGMLSAGLQFSDWCRPRGVTKPFVPEGAIRIKPLSLGVRIHDAEVRRGIRACRC